jgi:magnesium chelatase family protein
VALVGGGGNPKPGEISLAHHGVLFLDELPEFERRVLEVLREPMETGQITISRASRQAEYPARFQLIAAMNPCPCGHLGDGTSRCHCSSEQIARYRGRISGPLLDRIDMHVEVPAQPASLLPAMTGHAAEPSSQVRQRVASARQRQLARQQKTNQDLTSSEVEAYASPGPRGRELLQQAMERLGLSMRAYHRILKVARSIADLDRAARIEARHIGEAIGLRRFDWRQTGR